MIHLLFSWPNPFLIRKTVQFQIAEPVALEIYFSKEIRRVVFYRFEKKIFHEVVKKKYIELFRKNLKKSNIYNFAKNVIFLKRQNTGLLISYLKNNILFHGQSISRLEVALPAWIEIGSVSFKT